MLRIAFACLALIATPALAEPVTLRFGERRAAIDGALTGPRQSVTMNVHGAAHTYEGVPLSVLLSRVGAPAGAAIRGEALRNVVIVTGRDGYSAVLALAEVDAGMREGRVLLADREDGRVLGAADGPFRLVVEGDKRPARSVRQVRSIEVRTLQP